MTTKEEIACCIAFEKRKIAEKAKEDVERAKEEAKEEVKKAQEEAKKEVREETRKDTKLEMIDAMIAKTKLTDEEISAVSGIPLEEIQKRRAQQ